MTRSAYRPERVARGLLSLAGALVALQLAACGGAQPDEKLAVASAALRQNVCFSVQDLGPAYANPYDASNGINARGTVVGTRGLTSDQRTGFVFEHGKFTEVGSPELELRAVNASGLAVGGMYSATQPARALSYYKGVITDLGTLEGATESWAWGVNDRGVAIGDGRIDGAYHVAAFYGGKAFDLGVLGVNSYPGGINDHGDVVGSYQVDANTWRGFIVPRGGTIQDFEEATGVPGVGSVDKISNGGTVCGSADMPNGYHGFLWRDGTVTDLGDLGYGWSICVDVSDSGMAVATAAVDSWGDVAACLWRSAEEGMIDLNTRIPTDVAAHVYLWWSSGINSVGQITAWGWDSLEGTNKAYLLSPVGCR